VNIVIDNSTGIWVSAVAGVIVGFSIWRLFYAIGYLFEISSKAERALDLSGRIESDYHKMSKELGKCHSLMHELGATASTMDMFNKAVKRLEEIDRLKTDLNQVKYEVNNIRHKVY